ncbi:MAG: energy transducer TonB, partial [Steroidobacteraceae bacterium]
MKRGILAVCCVLAAPTAMAWAPCEQKGLTPPKPIHREAPAYPPAVRAIGIEGSVEVALTVLRDGSVGWVRVVRAEPRGYFEQAAAEGVRRWRFTPARMNGEAVECRMHTRVRFALTDAAAASAGATAGDRPQPVYPPALLQAGVEGYAEIEYT